MQNTWLNGKWFFIKIWLRACFVMITAMQFYLLLLWHYKGLQWFTLSQTIYIQVVKDVSHWFYTERQGKYFECVEKWFDSTCINTMLLIQFRYIYCLRISILQWQWPKHFNATVINWWIMLQKYRNELGFDWRKQQSCLFG